MPESVFTHTLPLLFAGGAACAVDEGGVLALVVLPELAVVGGAAGGSVALLSVGSAFVLDFVFFEVVDVAPEAACGAAVESVDSVTGFFLVLLEVVESLCA